MDISGNTITDDNVETIGTTKSITISTGSDDTLPLAQLNEIMDNDFVANASVLNNMDEKSNNDWEENYFKQFDWLSEDTANILDDPNDIVVDMQSIPHEERLNMFLDCCKLL